MGTDDTIPAVVARAAAEFGELEAITDGDVRWNFSELQQHVDRAAKGYLATGLEPGDRVAIWAPNVVEWVLAALGAVTAGGIVVPLTTRYKGAEAAWVINRSRARFVMLVNDFLGNDFVGALRDVDGGTPSVETVVVLRGDAPHGTLTWTDFIAAGTAVDAAALRQRSGAVSPANTSDIIFTSGTTGRPKGVMASHGQSVRVFSEWSELAGLRRSDRYLIVNPFSHTFGYKAGILACLLRGATIVPEPVFDVDAVLRRVAAERITMLPGPPTIYLSILNHAERDRYDLSSLRTAVTGAAPVPVEMIRRMREELTFDTIITAYGLTESTGTVTMCRPGDDAETISTSSGRAITDVEVRIVDDDGNDLAAGTPGEIVCRGYNVMAGYFEDPAATAEAIDPEGWLHTGDIGVMDERGYVDITDRKKDMFISGGFNAYPAEIEATLLEHPGIAQAAVVGMPDDRLGEVACAFVIPRAGAGVDPAEVVAWSKQRMAGYKYPRRVEVVDRFPTNAIGKVLKYELRAALR
jgi:acyl-CoA synthetase (AMP-forming)/AMP-acid ligase II